jgi:hypothetical protein
VNNITKPDVDAPKSKFGMSYTSAHVIETKLAKMLNDIKVPKQMYSSILKWGQDAYNQGYNFVPRHGTKELLISSLQTQLHLNHFRPEKIEIKLLGDNLRVEITRFNFTSGLHSLLRHPDLTSDMANLDPFGKYISPNGRVGAVNSGQWYRKAYHTCIKDPNTEFMVPINETASLYNAQTSHLKYQCLHAIVKVILETLIDAQTPNALDGIEVTLGGITKIVNIHVPVNFMPVNFIIGDMQGRE